MIDRFGKEVDFSELFMEETLSAKDKKTIPDDQWGLIIKNDNGEIVERKFPLNDETHVRQAAIFFDRAKGLSDDQKRELARNIVRRAKELDMDYSGWESLKPYLDKPVKESYYDPDPDSTSGTSDFDDNDLDDEYYGEADQALMNQIQTNEDKIPILQLRTYAKKCLHEGKSYNGGDKAYIFECIKNDANNQDKRCHEYFFNLIKEIDKCVGDQDLRKIENRPQKWFRYEKLINKFFSSIGVRYGKDRVVTSINLRAHSLTFLEKEFVKFRYDPTTDILIHRSRRNNLLFLKPSHAAGDGPIYPKPRIYFTLEPRSRYTSVKGAYGDYAYEPNINKPIDVLYDTESPSHASINVSSDKYGKDVFINTYKPLAVKQITSDNIQEGFSESFEEMFGPVIQEAFDAITGEEIPINHAYTMEEMAKRSLSLDEAKAMEKDGLIPIKPPKTDEVYFGSPTNHMPEIDLNRPLFVSPYKGIASIFIWGDMGLQNRIPRGSYNHNYEEWINFDEKKMKNPLKEVHVYVEGAPFLEPFTVEQEGYIHCISTKDYLNNFFRKPWMSKDLEYLIAKTDNMKVEFTRSIKCKVKYYIKGRPSPKGKSYGPSKGGILQYIHDIADKIHAKYKADQKEPTGNQNCLLCAWCAEASIRGGDYLPRPVYSPRDPALEIVPGDIVGGVTKKNTGNFHDMLTHLRKDSIGQPFARWYCHVKWGHSNGGHEFLIVKIDEDAFNIMDPQQGIVRPLTADDSYMKDVDWEETYICRIDDKPFKYMKLDQINDPKKTLPWDPKKDIPYMVKHGLCTKEEAEKELKKAETNLFTSELKKSLKQTHIQESASDPMTIIPKDLRDWLKKGDYSSLEKDDSYYYVEGHPVEEFWREPEFCKGCFYPDEEDDPILHCIVFSNDNGNGLVYDWTDECYYYAYHDWIDDDTGFLHRERLSSKSWTQIIDPTHSKIIRDSDEKRSKISKELTHLKGNPIYDDIEYGATNSHFGKGFFKSDCSAMEKRWNAIGHEWCNAVEDFADKHKFSELSEAVDTFANKTMSLFVPTFGSHEYDIEAYKEGAKNVIKAFQDVEKSLKESPIQESAWNDIRNGVNPWSDKLVFHISPQGHLDGQVFNPRVPEYLAPNKPGETRFEDTDNPRVCFSTSIEGCLNAILVNIARWKTANKLGDWYVYVPEKPLKEYKHSTNKDLIKDKKVFDANVTKEIWIEEPVRLKQYGVIRIDQVHDRTRKKTVPNAEGNSDSRSRYSFKWHWLVRPSVIKDLPYDYSPIAVCNNMEDDISGFKYGLGYGGYVHSASSKEYDEKYRLESPEEFEKNGGGICYDFVEWQVGYLEAYGYTCRKFYISTETKDKVTHTFILVDDGKGGFIYPEAAFEPMKGVHKVKYPEEAVRMIIERFFKICDDNTIKYYVWEYSGHPPYGSTMKECTEYFTEGEPFMEGSMNKPEKIKRKD